MSLVGSESAASGSAFDMRGTTPAPRARDWEALPIATVEYATVPGASFNQWDAAVSIKTRWRF